MRAGQVDQFYRPLAGPERADVAFDGYARVIADALGQAGQPIEQRALAGIRIADDRNTGIGLVLNGNLADGDADCFTLVQAAKP